MQALPRAPRARRARLGRLAAGDEQVVEELGRQVGLEQAGVDLLQGDVAAEGEAAPAPGDRFGLGGRLDRAQAPAPGVGEQLLAADVAVLEAGVAQQPAQVGGGEGVDVDLALERVAVGLLGLGDGARLGADQRAARRARRAGRPASAARRGGRRSARARRRRRSRRPGRSTRRNSAKARSRSGMWWRTAWPKTRSKLSSSKGSSSASVATVSTSRPSASAVAASRFSIPGEMSVAVSRSIAPSCSRLSEK